MRTIEVTLIREQEASPVIKVHTNVIEFSVAEHTKFIVIDTCDVIHYYNPVHIESIKVVKNE